MPAVELVFTDPDTVKSVEQRAGWFGLSKERYMQRLVDGEPMPITPDILRRQIRWLARNLERMASDITPENRDPGPKFAQWYQRFAEVFDLPLPLASAEERFRQSLTEAINNTAPPPGWDENCPVRLVITPPDQPSA